jgi:hypothetical protein
LMRGAVGPTIVMAIEDMAVAHDEDTGTDDAIAVGVAVEQPQKGTPVIR